MLVIVADGEEERRRRRKGEGEGQGRIRQSRSGRSFKAISGPRVSLDLLSPEF